MRFNTLCMKNFIILLSFLLPVFAFAQTGNVTGTITEETTAAPASNATVKLVGTGTEFTAQTNTDGSFTVAVPAGQYRLDVTISDYTYTVGTYDVPSTGLALGALTYSVTGTGEEDKASQDNIPTVAAGEDDSKDAGTQSVSSTLNSSRDPFISGASYVLSTGGFRIRGYRGENYSTYLNGVPVNDIEDGYTSWGLWGGLNAVMHNRENTMGLAPTTFTFGGVGGAYSFDTRASKQRKQLQISYSNTNRTYKHKLSVTYSTGLLKHGWAVSVSATRRWASEGYVPGTFYDGYSYFLSVEKYFGSNQSLALTVLGSPTRTGRASASVMEMYDLAGSHYYNPNWGYQNGKVRNARVSTTNEPMFFLTHEWKINDATTWSNSAGFTFGTHSTSSLDWFNARDPRPDYYSNLPSYLEDSTLKKVAMEQFREDINLRQINWAALYDANSHNFESIDSVNGIAGNIVSGKRANYIVQSAVENIKKFDFASTLNHSFNGHIAFTAGLSYQLQMTEYYKKVEDLLGADFFVDVNQFALRDFPDSLASAQNDLNHPNRILKEGDKYGYDYVANIHRGAAWAQGVFKFKHIDFFAAAELSGTAFWRDGKTKFGLFPNSSYGKSATQAFFNYAFKAGLTYQINTSNYLFVNAAHLTRAPYFGEAFVSPRTRNQVVDDLKSEVVYSVEGGYQLRTPKFKLKLDMYFSQFNNQTKTYTFYDGDAHAMVNYTLTGINTRHWGAELGAEWRINRQFTATAVASMGRYTYTSRPSATITQDNSQEVLSNETVYAKGFNVGGTPQAAVTFGLNYRDPKFWFAGVNFNYYDWMWVEFSPARRTVNATAPLDPNSDIYKGIIDQERLKGQFTMDFNAGYSWLLNKQFKNLKKKYFIVFNLSVTNILNNKNMIINSYEQLRFDFKNNDITRFPSKYLYAFGATYMFNITFRM